MFNPFFVYSYFLCHEHRCAPLNLWWKIAIYDNLKSLGINNPHDIDRYSLLQEANNDILKIYFRKDKGEFFAKSVKFKYPRQRKTVVADNLSQGYKEVQEISPDLRHLESVVTNKIAEIEGDLDKLTCNNR